LTKREWVVEKAGNTIRHDNIFNQKEKSSRVSA
jgi:hypothetical protein